MAEVLITLAIIGVVATMTIPTLIANYNQKSWDTATSVFNRRLGEALKIMNASGTLANHDTTAEFVEELSKHIKIVKTCDNTNLTDCFVSEISTGTDTINTADLKDSKNLNFFENYATETVGVQFANGISALVAYNPNATQDLYSNQIVTLSDNGNSVVLGTDALSILYDVSGLKTPNEYGTGKDIRGINIKLKVVSKICASNGVCIANIGTDYKGVDCTDPTAKGYSYCSAEDVTYSENYGNNYWVGAKYVCAELGMELPERGSYDTSTWQCKSDAAENTLCGIYNNSSEYGISSGLFWSISSSSSTDLAWSVDLSNGYTPNREKDDPYNVICIVQ